MKELTYATMCSGIECMSVVADGIDPLDKTATGLY